MENVCIFAGLCILINSLDCSVKKYIEKGHVKPSNSLVSKPVSRKSLHVAAVSAVYGG